MYEEKNIKMIDTTDYLFFKVNLKSRVELSNCVIDLISCRFWQLNKIFKIISRIRHIIKLYDIKKYNYEKQN